MIVWGLCIHIFKFYDFPAEEENIPQLFCIGIWLLPEHTPGYVLLWVLTTHICFCPGVQSRLVLRIKKDVSSSILATLVLE